MFFKLCCLAGKPWWGRRGTAAPLHHSALMCQALCLCVCVCVCASVCACVWCICVTRDSTLPTGSQERATGLRERERERELVARQREQDCTCWQHRGTRWALYREDEEFGRDLGVGVSVRSARVHWWLFYLEVFPSSVTLQLSLLSPSTSFSPPSLLLSPPLPQAHAPTAGGSLNRWKSSSESSGLLRAESNRSVRG